MNDIPRPIDQVLRAILNQIPNEYSRKKYLENRFESLINSAAYTAPEAQSMLWERAAHALSEGMSEANTKEYPWAFTVQRIFNAKLAYKSFL